MTGSRASSAREIDGNVDATLREFSLRIGGARELLAKSAAVLVFPSVIKAGMGIGGEYGEGVLRVGGRSVAYYSIAAGSIGFQLGAQRKSIIIVFLQDQALRDFRAKARTDKAWSVGVDGSVVLLNLGAQASINSATINQPIVGFVFGQSGLMYDLSLQGTKITRLNR